MRTGQEAVIENAHIIINHLIKLVHYPHKMVGQFPCTIHLLLQFDDSICLIKLLYCMLDADLVSALATSSFLLFILPANYFVFSLTKVSFGK